MRCQQVRRLLSAYDDGELSVAKQCRVQEHLHRCPECQAAFAELQAATWLVEQEVRLAEPPPHFAQNVMSALPSHQEVRRQSRRRAHGFALSIVATMVVALAFFNLRLPQSQIPNPKSQIPNLKSKVAVLPPAPKLEEELIKRFLSNHTRTPTMVKHPLIVRHVVPQPVSASVRRPPKPKTQNPKPTFEEPMETSPAVVMVSLGSAVEQHPTAEVRTVSSPQPVHRPRLTAELVSADTSWDGASPADGG